MGSSFADECFGVLVREMRDRNTEARLRFKGANEPIVAILKFVLAPRPEGQPQAAMRAC
jgi:hypothetical protein